MRNWENLYKKIGPLRYQSAESDCVPTTIVNGLTVLLERKLHPKLLQLIWALSLDQGGQDAGTGWVCCDVLSNLLTKWFERAHEDGYESKPLPYESRVIEGDAVRKRNVIRNHIVPCLESDGVVCLHTSSHYYLILGIENGTFMVFDCWWNDFETPKRLKGFGSYMGLVNTKWARKELKGCLVDSGYIWVHLLSKTGKSGAP